MNTAAKLGVYVLGLAVVFGGALGVGKATGQAASPVAITTASPGTNGHAAMTQQTTESHTEQAKSNTPGGLQVSENGYTLDPVTPIATGDPAEFRFTIIGPDGDPVTRYQVEHDKKLHFIVASRDLTSFQHVHPEMSADGTWSVKLAVPKPGSYRAFADFAPEGGEKLTLGADLQAAGDYKPEPLPEVSRTAKVGDYTVELDGDLVTGQSSKVTLTVRKDGKPVTDLQPYLGAYGHLVALRAGDLAYLHVHPEESATAGPEVTFYVEAPSRGDYRLFLDFQHDDKVRTAAFTATAATADGHAPSTTHGHG
ncbi:hypothetical protein [Nonomuraea maritima]|uniref:hypothetical protein n=1 Tax=Nonomuraea maritima TaxID=683260 RepID=UPI003719920C